MLKKYIYEENKRIGIITLNGYFNYGNRLQNYALENSLKKYNFYIATLIDDCKKSDLKNSKIKTIFKMSIRKKIELLNYKLTKKKYVKLKSKRNKLFEDFTLKNINEIKINIKENNLTYQYFIVGSDQVWNPNIPNILEFNFLNFANYNKRITYAPSFGVSKIPLKYEEQYKQYINGINKISVREEAGAKIIKDLTGRDATVVLDPTMLLDKEEWLKIAKEDKNKPKKDYLLTYFLGGIPKEYKRYIKNIAKENNLEIVDLANIKVPKYYVNGPSEFIDYINSAKLFMTDSFHGCVFSMLMETAFVVCKRNGHTEEEDMYSRIDTFVKKFKLENRQFENLNKDELFKFDYSKSYEILEIERKKSLDFLEGALGINNMIGKKDK